MFGSSENSCYIFPSLQLNNRQILFRIFVLSYLMLRLENMVHHLETYKHSTEEVTVVDTINLDCTF
jgi:hypothetical protein